MKNKVKQYTIQEIYDNPKLLLNKFRHKNDRIYFYYKIDSLNVYFMYYDTECKIIEYNYFSISRIKTWFLYDIDQTIDVF